MWLRPLHPRPRSFAKGTSALGDAPWRPMCGSSTDPTFCQSGKAGREWGSERLKDYATGWPTGPLVVTNRQGRGCAMWAIESANKTVLLG